MSIYNSYITEANSKMDIYDAKMDNEKCKIATINEMMNIKTTQVYNDIRTKIILENGSDADYSMLMEGAVDETLAQKKSILKKIFEWFENIFKAIKVKFDKIFKKDDNSSVSYDTTSNNKNIKYTIDNSIKDDLKDIDTYYTKIQQGLSQLKRGNYIDAIDTINKVDEPDIMKSDRSDNNKSSSEIDKADIDKIIEDLHDKLNTIERIIVEVKTNISSEDDLEKTNAAIASLQKLQDFVSAINKTITNIVGLKVIKDIEKSDDKKEDTKVESYMDDDYSRYF